MTAPGPTVTSGGDTQPGADSLFPTGFGGGGASVRPGGVGTGEILDGSIASADVDLASVGAALAAHSTFTGAYTKLLTTDAVSTSASGTLVAWHLTPVDATSAPATWTLPAANSVVAGVEVAVKKADTSTNTVTVSRAGSNLIFGTGSGSTSKTLTLAGEAVTLVSDGVSKWTVQTSDTPSGVLASTYATPGQVARGQVGPNPSARRLNQTQRTVMTSPPTITHGANAGSTTIASAVTMLMSDARVRWVNARTNSVVASGDTYYQGGTAGTSQGADFALQRTTWEIDTDAPDVEFRFYADYGGMWVIDGQPIDTTYGVNGKGAGVKSWTKLRFSTVVGSSWTLTDAGDLLTSATVHGLAVGDRVVPGAITTTTGITAGTTYWVKTVPSTTTATLSATRGGSTLALTTDGSTASVTKLLPQWRTIRFEGYAAGVIAMAVGPNDSIAAPARLSAATLGVLGDSFGQQASTENVYDLYPRAGRLLGFDTVYDSSVGGTGFLWDNSGAYTTFRSRLTLDLLPQTPTAFGVFGGLNDQGRFTKAALQAEMTLLFAAIRAYSTVAPIISAAPFTPNLTNASTSNYTDIRDAALAALQATAGPWVFLDALTGSVYAKSATGVTVSTVRALPWITGNGKDGAATGTGNADIITQSDGTHPTPYGVEWYARRIATEASAALASIGY